jgi:hypothetical protein
MAKLIKRKGDILKSFVFCFFTVSLFFSKALAITHFDSSQLNFKLSQQGLNEIQCHHKPLKTGSQAPPPPWWTVICDEYTFTVDVWMDEYVSKGSLYSISLLYHVKESVSSSGEKLTQFNTQSTQFKFNDFSQLKEINTSIDVRNGLADLNLEVKFN